MRLLLKVGIVAIAIYAYTRLSKPMHQTSAYQNGYDDGYYTGLDYACYKFRQNLPATTYANSKPLDC